MKCSARPTSSRVPTNWARRRPIPGTLRLESEGSGVNVLSSVVDDALFWVGMRAGVVGLVAVAFSNEVGTITTLSKCSSKLAMLTGNGQRTLAVR